MLNKGAELTTLYGSGYGGGGGGGGGNSDNEGCLSAGELSYRANDDPSAEHPMVTLTRCMRPLPEARQMKDIKKCVSFLRSTSPLLKGVAYDILLKLIRYSRLVKVFKDDIIVKQGSLGKSVYVLLSGRASVYVTQASAVEQLISASRPSISSAPCGGRPTTATGAPSTATSAAEPGPLTINIEAYRHHVEEEEGPGVLNRSIFGTLAMNYEVGQSFGEISLMSDSGSDDKQYQSSQSNQANRAEDNNNTGRRNASILADSECDLLIIDRELYEDTLRGKQQAEFEERHAFVSRHPLFKHMSRKNRRAIEMSLKKEEWAYDSSIVKQGNTISAIYFIARGQMKVTIEPKKHRQQFPIFYEKMSESLMTLNRDLDEPDSESQTLFPEHSLSESIRVRRRCGYVAAEERVHCKRNELCCVDDDDVVGDIELILGLDRYTHSVRCTSHTIVYSLELKHTDRLIKKNLHLITALTAKVKAKLRGRCKTRHDQDVEMYRISLQHLLSGEREIKFEERKSTKNTRCKSASGATPRHAEQDALDESKREVVLAQMVKLFLEDRIPMIEPRVPNSLYYRIKSRERANRRAEKARRALLEKQALLPPGSDKRMLEVKKPISKSTHGRLFNAATNANKKQPRSRRQLAMMNDRNQAKQASIGELGYQRAPRARIGSASNLTLTSTNTEDSVVGVSRKPRPHTSIAYVNPKSSYPVNETKYEDLPKRSHPRPHTAGVRFYENTEKTFITEEVVLTPSCPRRSDTIPRPLSAPTPSSGDFRSRYGRGSDDAAAAAAAGVNAAPCLGEKSRGALDRRHDHRRALTQQAKLAKYRREHDNAEVETGGIDDLLLGGVQAYQSEEEFSEDLTFDIETGDRCLSTLEDKIRIFHGCLDSDNPSGKIPPSVRIATMRRFSIQKAKEVPVAGGTVCIREKKCKYAKGAYVNTNTHQHIRRFILAPRITS